MARLAGKETVGPLLNRALLRAGVWTMGRVSQSRLVPSPVHRPLFKMATRLGQSIPPGVVITKRRIATVPVEQLSYCPSTSAGWILYLHGGAYVLGAASTHRGITSRLCALTGRMVVTVDYGLAPEHPFPAAVTQARAVYAALLEQGVAPQDIILAGDSAGGGLAIGTALAIRDAGMPCPAAIVAMSPWGNLDHTPTSSGRPHRDLMLNGDYLASAASRYLGGKDHLARHPWASPVHGDFHGLPPLLIQVDKGELLYDDALRLTAAARRAGVPVELQCWQGLWHVWQFFAGRLDEADQALERIARFMASHSSSPAAPGH